MPKKYTMRYDANTAKKGWQVLDRLLLLLEHGDSHSAMSIVMAINLVEVMYFEIISDGVAKDLSSSSFAHAADDIKSAHMLLGILLGGGFRGCGNALYTMDTLVRILKAVPKYDIIRLEPTT